MDIRVESRQLGDVCVLVPQAFQDDRGFFTETFRADQFKALGLPTEFVQDNHSGSVRGVLRGLHFQWSPPMGKLMRVTRGTAFLVAVDIRKGSPTLGGWFGAEISADNRKQIWAPAGFARGFCVLSDDPEIGIEWPLREVQLSDKDCKAQTLKQWLQSSDSENFRYTENHSLVGK